MTMLRIYLQLVPLFFMFGLGVFLHRMRFAERHHGEFLLRFMFFITLPCLVFLKLTQVHLDLHQLSLPLVSVGVNLGCMLVTLAVTRFIHVPRQTRGAMLVSTMIANNAFMFPFMQAVYGDQGFAYAVLFDFGNAMVTSTLTYAMAFHFGPDRHTSKTLITKTLRSPLVWALFLAVAVNFLALPLPHTLRLVLAPIGGMTNPLILISLGIMFSPKLNQLRLLSATLFIKMGLGLILGVLIARLLGLHDLSFTVAMLCAAGPIGFNALTFSTLAGLDAEFASSAVSASILLGVVYIPLLMHLAQHI